MKTFARPGSRTLSLIFFVLAASCSSHPETPVLPAGKPAGSGDASGDPSGAGAASASPSASASASASSTAAPEKLEPPSVRYTAAWTDADVVEEIAKDCHWKQADPPPGSVPAMSCEIHPEQSCVYSPCNEELEDKCFPMCQKGCEKCGATCVATCDECKAKCADDACRRACARTTGDCRQACLKAEDHCTSNECWDMSNKCNTKLRDDWDKSPCQKHVPKRDECLDKCVDDPKKMLSKTWAFG